MSNNADLGITIQKLICDKYALKPHENAVKQFESNFNYGYATKLFPIIDKIFFEIGLEPIQCLTYAPSPKENESLSPHNFILSNGSTLSIRTNRSGDKVAPRVVGQCGLQSFNEHFGDIAGFEISAKNQIKKVVYEKIDKMLPIFLDYLFVSNYTVWVFEDNKGEFDYLIVDNHTFVDINWERAFLSFTRDPQNWLESTTLKYFGISLAEIQIHKNRTFKFRFIMNSLLKFIKLHNTTTETLGITAEKVICTLYNIPIPQSYRGRFSSAIAREIEPTIAAAFMHLPAAIRSTGSEKGSHGKNSKCPYDFILEGNKTLSLKTNTGKYICPPEVGQPGAATCYEYFGHLTKSPEITADVFKEIVLDKVSDMIPIYLQYLLDSDYLLWIYKRGFKYHYKIFESDFARNMVWDPVKFSFTKESIDTWNESNTLKYDNITIGEFQVHRSRSCFKFRFNMENLELIIRRYCYER